MGDIKIGNSSIILKLGSSDVTAAYLGSTLVYSGGTPTYNNTITYVAGRPQSINGNKFRGSFGQPLNVLDDQFDDNTEEGYVVFDDDVVEILNGALSSSSMKSIVIPDSVISIGDEAFVECSELTSITIPSGVTYIGIGTFANCYSLTSVTIPSGITSISESVLYGCSSLTSIDIPNGVTSIGNYAFYDCTGLTSITVNATTPPTLGGTSAFTNTNDCPIYVPSGSVNTYKSSTRWSSYASRIQAMPTWSSVQHGDSLSNLTATAMRVSTAITLSETHNVTFGDTSSNTYTLLYENGNWYNWRIMTNGSFTPDSKTLLTASDGYYTIVFDSTYHCLGADADAYGQGGTMNATFDFEIG